MSSFIHHCLFLQSANTAGHLLRTRVSAQGSRENQMAESPPLTSLPQTMQIAGDHRCKSARSQPSRVHGRPQQVSERGDVSAEPRSMMG